MPGESKKEKNLLSWIKNLEREFKEKISILNIKILIFSIGLSLMMNGSSSDPYRQIAFLLLVIPLMITLVIPLTQPVLQRLWAASIAVVVCLLAWLLLQSTPLGATWLHHSVWQSLDQVGIAVQPTLSVAPAATRASIPGLILPMLVFAAMLVLCQKRREAVLAWKVLASIGLFLAGLSVCLELFFPQARFFSSFEVGRSSFNGIFVNRNTMAAFLGLVAFATAGWLMLPRPKAQRDWLERTGLTAFGWERTILSVLLFLLVISLIMTRSRAGVSLAFLCLTLTFAGSIFLLSSYHPEEGKNRSGGLVRAAQFVFVFAISSGIFVFFGDPVVSRMGSGTSDGRLCAWNASWQMFLERPVIGLGFGTFADAFPQYRDPVCLGQSAAWTRAHNSYLELLAGMGLIGFVFSFCLTSALFLILVRGIRMRKTLRPIPVFALGALLFIILHSIVDFPLQIPGVAIYFSALMGAGCAIASQKRR
jgi:O-antigen ligase